MSNSIWKTGNPTYRNDNFDEIIVREYKRWAADGVFYLVDDCTELPNRWAYLLDIITQADKAELQADKAERLQKALDLALDTLKKAETTRELTFKGHYVHAISLDELHSALKEIEQLTKGE